MTKMLTLFGRDVSELKYNDLKRENQAQRFLLKTIKMALKKELYFRESKRILQSSDDKVALLQIYINNLEAFIAEIEYWTGRRLEPESNCRKGKRKPKRVIREENYAKKKQIMAEDNRLSYLKAKVENDGLAVSWDKEKFMSIAADRGYQTEGSLIGDIAKELELDRSGAQLIINRGRFTWGQVLCLGALLEMTPKEFCDTFLAGFFIDQYGEYRASIEALNKRMLLRRAVSKPISIEVGSDGRPLDADEEIWFDD